MEISAKNIELKPSQIEKICLSDFSLISDSEKVELRSRLYDQLALTHKETWARYFSFIVTFAIFYILSKGHAEEFSQFGIKFKDFEFLLQYYPFYILFLYYQFSYNIIWSGFLMRQIDILNRILMPEIADKRHHYFTFSASPVLLKNWCAFNFDNGLKTSQMGVSFLTSTARMFITILAMYYVVTYNIEKYGWFDIVNLAIYGFAFITLIKWFDLIRIFKDLCMAEVSLQKGGENA